MVWFGLVGFYAISTIVGYLMPNIILNIYMICKHFVDNILKRARAFFCPLMNDFKYCFIKITIQHQSFV